MIDMFCFPYRVKAVQTELGQQILADFEEAFPSQGTKVLFCIFLPVFIYYHLSFLIHTHYSYYSFTIPEVFASSRRSVCQTFRVMRPSLILNTPKQC